MGSRWASWTNIANGVKGFLNDTTFNKINAFNTAIDNAVDEINRTKADQSELAVERGRIDSILSLPSGATTNDARLEDIKVGVDGKTYTSPGEAVRGQVGDLKDDLSSKSDAFELSNLGSLLGFEKNVFDATDFKSGNTSNWTVSAKKTSLTVSHLTSYQAGKPTATLSLGIGNYIFYTTDDNAFSLYKDGTFLKDLKNKTKFDIVDGSVFAINISKAVPTGTSVTVDGIAISLNTEDRVTKAEKNINTLEERIFSVERNVKEIPLVWEQGSMSGNGNDADSTNTIRTQKIDVNTEKMYVFVAPYECKTSINAKFDYLENRVNLEQPIFGGLSVKDVSGFIRFILRNADGTAFTTTNVDLTKAHLYEVTEHDTVTVGKRGKCDFLVDDDSAQAVLSALVNCNKSLTINVRPGSYPFNHLYTATISGAKYCIGTWENIEQSVYHRITIKGTYAVRRDLNEDGLATMFNVAVSPTDLGAENAFLLVPRRKVAVDTDVLTYTQLDVSRLAIYSTLYTKPFIHIDATHANSFTASDIIIRADGNTGGTPVLSTRPVGSVGIRAGYGSNNGLQNIISSCLVYACEKGYSICGEHYVLTDCLAHHCYIGFAFGDRLTRGNYEHPNVMIGCSIEACYRLMLLSRYGETLESTSPYTHNTLVATGISTEDTWFIPSDEGGGTQATLPILEVIKGAYRGRIEIDYYGGSNTKSCFEDGSGTKMDYIVYKQGATLKS